VLGTGEPLTWYWLLLLPALLMQAIFNVGAALIMARVGAGAQDISQLVPFLLRVWRYFCGVMYSIASLPAVADAHYHGPALRSLPANVTWTTRLPKNAVLHDLAPPPVRKPGRPPRKALGSAPPLTWPPPHPGPRPSYGSTAGTPPRTWPRSPACGTAAWM
jgi:ABC-2 type transporter